MTNNRDPREILSEYDMLSTVPGEIEDLEWGNEFVSEMATALSQTLEELAMFGDVLVVARNAPINFLQAERDALEAIVNEMRTKNDALKARCSEQDVDLTRCIERLERSESRCSKVEAERDLLTVMLIEQDAIKARCSMLETVINLAKDYVSHADKCDFYADYPCSCGLDKWFASTREVTT